MSDISRSQLDSYYEFPCATHDVIYHEHNAMKMLLLQNNSYYHNNYNKLKPQTSSLSTTPYIMENDICKHMLFIDKVKDEKSINFLWNKTSYFEKIEQRKHINTLNSTNTMHGDDYVYYYNLTELFIHDGTVGWETLLRKYKSKHF